ncbi:MAG: hypothetical protein HN623_06905, partial [Bdellovibrionales bacterium]|nr:hypothetical protein [Bdellovibrionales bacterium]
MKVQLKILVGLSLLLLAFASWGNDSDYIRLHNQYVAPHTALNYSLEVPAGVEFLTAKITWNSNPSIYDLFLTLRGVGFQISDCRLVVGYSAQCVVHFPPAG